ncbi:MAG: mycothiol conjugate amidase Mca [Acidimicrobiia bacterium]|nr:MAG: mycothiol conjugate amidase Mca [Acidimicrobiia bacterium]
MSRTLLSLHAHPDDESSKGAGTVARYSDAGVRTVLVTATGGEAGDVLNPAADSEEARRDIGAVRRRELFEAAKILGFDDVIMLGYRDSGMPDTPPNSHSNAFVNADTDKVLKRLVAIVRSERPQVMLGYDEHEWYPHPDHLRVHALSLPLFEAAADPERYPDVGEPWEVAKLYAPTFSRSRLEILHAAMEERGLSSPYGDWLGRLPPLDGEEVIDARIDVGDYIERARTALAAHRTQIAPDGPWFQVPTDLMREVYPYEDFELLATRVEQGPAGSDLFEGVDE